MRGPQPKESSSTNARITGHPSHPQGLNLICNDRRLCYTQFVVSIFASLHNGFIFKQRVNNRVHSRTMLLSHLKKKPKKTNKTVEESTLHSSPTNLINVAYNGLVLVKCMKSGTHNIDHLFKQQP